MRQVERAIRTTADLGRPDWPSVYERHAPELARYLTKLTGDRESGVDLMQDTFARGIAAESTLLDPTGIRPWLYRIATNLALRHLRRRRLIAFLPFAHRDETGGIPEPRRLLVRQVLRALPPAQAAALLLHYDSGFTRAEIAQMQGVSDEAVKSRLARGRQSFMAAYRRLDRGLKT